MPLLYSDLNYKFFKYYSYFLFSVNFDKLYISGIFLLNAHIYCILFAVSSTIPVFIPDVGDLCLFPFSVSPLGSSVPLFFSQVFNFVFSINFYVIDKLSQFLYVWKHLYLTITLEGYIQRSCLRPTLIFSSTLDINPAVFWFPLFREKPVATFPLESAVLCIFFRYF